MPSRVSLSDAIPSHVRASETEFVSALASSSSGHVALGYAISVAEPTTFCIDNAGSSISSGIRKSHYAHLRQSSEMSSVWEG